MTQCPHCHARPTPARILRRPFGRTYSCSRCAQPSRYDTNQLQAVGFAVIVSATVVRVLCFDREDTSGLILLILATFSAVIAAKTYLVRLHPLPTPTPADAPTPIR